MKRTFTFLMTALFLCVGMTVKAQHWLQPTVSTDKETYEYYIANYRNGDYFVTSTKGLSGGAQQLGSANAFDDTKAKVTFKLVEGGKLWSTNTTTPLIVGYTTTDGAANSVQLFAEDSQEGYTWKIESANGGNTLSAGSSDNSWNMHGGAGANIGLYGKTDGGSNWVFIPANDAAVAKAAEARAEYAPSTEYYYQIKNVKHSRMLAANATNATSISKNSTADLNQLWAFEEGEDGAFYLRNAGQEKYLVATSSNNTAWTVGAEGSAFELEMLNFSIKNWTIHVVGQDGYGCAHDANWGTDAQIVRWEASAEASQWYLEKTEISTKAVGISLVYSLTYNGEEKFTQTCTGFVGEAYPEVNVALPFGVVATKPAGELTADVAGKVVEVKLSDNLPFTYAADVKSVENWYYLLFHATGKNYLYYAADDAVLEANKTAVDTNDKDAYAWAFVGNPFDGFKVYNKKAGKFLDAAKDGAVVAAADEQVFTLTASSHASNGFFMQAKDGEYKERFNKQGDKVVYWSGADAGSTFMVWSEITYELTDALGNTYTGAYEGVAGTDKPTLSGVAGYTLSNEAWNGATYTAKIAFPFPVSNAETTNATMISNFNAGQRWHAVGDDVKVQTAQPTNATKGEWLWAIYPKFENGAFTFTVKNVGNGKFVTLNKDASSFDTQGTVTLTENGTALEVINWNGAPCFKVPGKTLYLTINGSGDKDVYLATWTGGNNGHGGNKLHFTEFVDVSSVTLDKTEATLTEAGATVTLVATVAPENAADKKVTWSTSDDKVATVVDGVVTAVANGKATITAKAGEKTATCEVTVAIPEVEYADAELINAFIAEVVAIGELSYDLDATWAALPAVLAELNVVTPLIEQLEAGEPVVKTEVEAATATVANAKAVATYYNETYLPTAKAASALLATLEEGSAEHTALSAAIAACDLSAVTTVAELEAINTALAEAVEANTPEGGLVKTDYTDAIKNAAVTSKDDWTIESDGDVKYGDNHFKTSVKNLNINQTITLPAGKYKMTVKAAYRYGADPTPEEDEYAAIMRGDDTHLAKLYAETATYKYEANVQNRWEGRSETDLYGNLEKVTAIVHEDVTYYVPNSSAAVYAWFEKGKYVNELVFNVQEEGEVTIGIAKSSTVGDYTNISAWTLTRLGDAEADPKVELEKPEIGDVTSKYLVNADFETASPQNGGAINTPPGWTLKHETSGWLDGSTRKSENPGGDGSQCYNLWAGTVNLADIYQTVTLPAGKYKLKVGLYSDGEAERYAYATVGGNTIKSANAKFGSWDFVSVEFLNTSAGKVTLGAVSKGWFQIDNVTLEYLGEVLKDDFVNAYNQALGEAQALVGQKMDLSVATQLDAVILANGSLTAESSIEDLDKATNAISAVVVQAKASAATYAANKIAIDGMFALINSTNVYTVEAYEAYKAKAEGFLTQYDAGTLNATVDNPAAIHGWHATADYCEVLLSAFGIAVDDWANLHINTWSTEGETDGSDFKVPFYEYWTGDGESLGVATKTATVTGLTPGKSYEVEAWVRVRAKNGVAATDATGITLSVGEGEATDITEGEVIGTSQFSHAVFTATGKADETGALKINFNILEGNNVSWLSFKNVKYTEVEVVEPEYLTVVGAKVGDVDIVEGKATVESISSFDITFDRPVALAEDAEWAQLTDSWGDNSLKAEVLEDNNSVVRFSLQWGLEFTEAGDFYLYIPEGVVVDAENADIVNAAIEAVITIEGGSVEPATPLAVVNVTVGEDVMADLSAIVATTEDMIKVNFDGKFYFQGEPSIVDAEGEDASSSFEYMNGLDVDGSNSYIFMGKKEGTYTITLAKAQFNELEMMGWKAPAEDIVLKVTISVPDGIQNINVDADAVIYDIHGRRVEKMTKGLYIVNGKKVLVK